MKTSANKNSVKNSQVINDFGQKIGGAHKDRAREAAERLRLADVAGLLSKPLAKVAKLPDLRGLYLSGHITAEAARRAWWLWAQIGPKPSGARVYRLQGWAERAAVLIAAVADVLAYGVPEKSQLPDEFRPFQKWELFGEEMEAANWPADEYARGTYFVGPYLWGNGGYSIHNPKSSYYKRFETVAECVAAIREKVGGAVRAASVPKFAVYFSREAGAYYIAPAGKSGIKLAEVPGYSEGFDYIDTHSEELAAKYEELKKLPAERHDWNRPRVGADYRHGADLTPEAFAAVFPFRGVEFGNWVTQIERAACLNEAADALHDLAAVLGIIPEAVTLGGSLAWAFGSRGVGRAAAHYETARRVINLTKRKGNGCVAHEWFHALDHSIMVEEGRPLFFAVADGSRYGDGEKSPIFAAAADLKKALLSSPMYARSVKIDEFRSTPYWSTVTEMAARAFEVYMLGKLEAAGVVNDYLVSVIPFEKYLRPECYPYPTREEAAGLAPLFDAFIMAAFGEGERVNGADPEAEAAQIPAPPAAVVYDPAQPVERAEFQTVDAEGVAYDEPEKSQICARLEEIRADILSESVSYEEIAYLQEHADMIAPGDTLLLEWADVPEQPAPVAASEPMNAEEDEAPTPADGVQGFDIDAMADALAAHQRAKDSHPSGREAVNLYRIGDEYAAIFADAADVVAACPLLTEERHPVGYPVARFQAWRLDEVLPRIIRHGLKVCIYDTPTDLLPLLEGMAPLPPMNPTDPNTPNGGGEPSGTDEQPAAGAAYGDAEKSQNFVRPEVEALRQQARRAGTWTSFDPEKLGDSLIYELENALQSFESNLPEEIRAEKVAAYISKWREWLAARSRCISSAVTGPARFPVARAEKLNEYERNAWNRLQEWADKVVKRCNAEKRLTGWDEVERLTAKVEKLEQLQEAMKEANKIVRQRISDVEKLDALVALGWSEQEAQDIMTPDYIGRVGFASFQLTNNLAKIKDTRAKIVRHEALASQEDKTVAYQWGELEYCFSEERYRLHFPGKPSAEILAFLKSHGWKWSRVNCAWQRQITPGARYNLKQFIEKFGGKVEQQPMN